MITRSDLIKLDANVQVILLGTVFEELQHRGWVKTYADALKVCDIYLPHPREKLRPKEIDKVLENGPPAEAVIKFLLEKYNNNVTVYHFNSSAAVSFIKDKRVTLIDLYV